jgi:hypothetical protein
MEPSRQGRINGFFSLSSCSMSDLAAISMIFLVLLGPAAIYLTADTKRALFYFIGLLVIYGLTSQAARTYGKRFVTSALAIESSTS